MSSNNSVQYTSLRRTDPLPEWENLSDICALLENAHFVPPVQKMIAIRESTVPYQEVVDKVIKLRPTLDSMRYNGDYLTAARRIKNMTDQANYRPAPPSLLETCFVCMLTPGCRERLLLEEGGMTEEELTNWQSLDEFAMAPLP